jgi:uncharacterized protein (DUF302 family)
MATRVLLAVVWLLGGIVLMGFMVWLTMPSLMLIEYKSPLDYEQTVLALNGAIARKQDWKVPKVFDYRQNIRDAGHGPIDRVGTATPRNPLYASRILEDEQNRKVTAFMPLGIVVDEREYGQVYISELNVGLLGMMFGGTIAEVMGDAGTDVKDVIASVTRQ